jgi:hypothetical protein
MNNDWRLSTFNGALVASYFIPSWTGAALKIWSAPVRGLYDRVNVAPALLVSDYLDLSGIQMVRFAWLLALSKVTVVAFFAIFLFLIVRVSARRSGICDEALAFALLFGAVISMASLLAARQVGEFSALRLHASETLMFVSAAILLIVDGKSATKSAPVAPTKRTRKIFPFGRSQT